MVIHFFAFPAVEHGWSMGASGSPVGGVLGDSGLVRAIDGVEDARVRVAEDTDGVQLGAQVYHLPRKRAAGTLR